MLCQRWGVGPTQIIEGEDAGYVLAMLRAISDQPPPKSEHDAMIDDLIDRAEVNVG